MTTKIAKISRRLISELNLPVREAAVILAAVYDWKPTEARLEASPFDLKQGLDDLLKRD